MKKAISSLMILVMVLSIGATVVAKENSYLAIEKNSVTGIDITTLPFSSSFSLQTKDRDKINTIIDYLNSLELIVDDTDLSGSGGFALQINIELSDGSKKLYTHYGNTWFFDDKETQYKMKYEQAEKFEGIV